MDVVVQKINAQKIIVNAIDQVQVVESIVDVQIVKIQEEES